MYPDLKNRYRHLVPLHCTQLLGPEYSLIRPEFYEYKDKARVRDKYKKVLVNFGGSDPTNEISKVLTAIKCNLTELNNNIEFFVIAGSANQQQEEIQEQCKSLANVKYYSHYDHMAELLSEMDLVIGAGGISLWERCFLGVPSMVIIIADNQIEVVQEAESQDLIWNLGLNSEVTFESIAQNLKSILSDSSSLARKSRNSIEFMGLLRNRNWHPILSLMEEGK